MRRARETFGGAGAAGGFAMSDTLEVKLPTEPTPPPPVTEKAARHDESLGKRQSYLRMGAIVEVPESDRAALAVASLVLSDRLQMDLRETQWLAYSIGASLRTLGEDRGLLSVSMGTAPDNLEKAEAEMRRVASELRAGPIETDEIQRVVAARVGRILMRRLPAQNQAMYDGLKLFRGRPTVGNLEFLEAISTVTPEQVAAAAKRYVDPERWVVAIVR
jgi:zinc protease